jgi:hypothetical protein
MPVPDFSPGEVLTAAAMDSIGLWLVKTQTIGTGVASVVVANAFSANYDSYKIMINGSSGGTTAANIGLSLGASVTGYYSGGVVYSYAAAGATPTNDNNAASWTRAAQCSTDGLNFEVTLMDPFLAKKTRMQYLYALPEIGFNGGFGAGFHSVASSYTGFTLTVGAGTITGGTIRVYGYRN